MHENTPATDEAAPIPAVLTPTEPAPADAELEPAAQMLQALGATNALTAIGEIERGKLALVRVGELESEIAKLRAQIDEGERVRLIATLRGEGKLTAHMERLAARMSLDALRDFAREAEPIAHFTAPPVVEPAAPSVVHGGKRWEDLSNMELHALSNDNPELYAALYADAERRKSSGR